MDELSDLGLWGDGDEVWAIEAGFEALAMEVAVEDASTWMTVGNVWDSAVSRRPGLIDDPAAWDSFREALSGETGAPWERVGPDTKLLDGKGHSIMSRLLKGIWRWLKADA